MGKQLVYSSGQWRPIYGSSTQAITSSLTVNIPTDYPTLQLAIDDLSKYNISQSSTIFLNIESGHRPESGIHVENGDYGRFTVKSTDAEVLCADTFTGMFIECRNARAPVLATIINLNFKGTYAAHISEASEFYINSYCGFKNGGGQGIYCRASRVRGGYIVLTGMGDKTIWCTRSSTVSLPQSDLSGQRAGDYGVYVSRGSIIDLTTSKVNNMNVTVSAIGVMRSRLAFIQSEVNNSAANAITASQSAAVGANLTKAMYAGNIAVFAQRGSTIDFSDGDARYATHYGLHALSGSTISAANAHVPNAGTNSVRASQGSIIDVTGSELRYSTNTPVVCETGSFIVAHGANTGAGSPSATNTNITTLNVMDGSKGVVWG